MTAPSKKIKHKEQKSQHSFCYKTQFVYMQNYYKFQILRSLSFKNIRKIGGEYFCLNTIL
jgi:hypothetical protein